MEMKQLVVNGVAYDVTDPAAARIDDQHVSQGTWSGRNIVQRLCPAFSDRGAVVCCSPVEGYPLSVVSHIAPVQEGSGDPTPDKWEDANSLYDYRIGDQEVAFRIPDGGTYKVTVQCDGQITGIGVYLESYSQSVPGVLEGNSFRFEMAEGYTGEVWIKANFAAEESETDFHLQKLVPGNIRPILPRSEVKLRQYHCKNHINDTFFDRNAWTMADNSAYYKQYPLPKLIPGKQYTVSIDSAGGLASPYFYIQKLTASSNSWITMSFLWTGTGTDGYKAYTFTAEDTHYRFWINNIAVVEKIAYVQLEEGAVATEYEPYHGQEYQMALGREVYGGTLDWQSGELTITKAMIRLTSDMPWRMTGASNPNGIMSFYVDREMVNAASTNQNISVFSSHYRYYPDGWSVSNVSYPYAIKILNDRIYLTDARFTDLESFLAFLDRERVQLVYFLDTPETVQLTPREILALSGANTIYGDTGDTTVSGKADPSAVIEKLTNAVLALGGKL